MSSLGRQIALIIRDDTAGCWCGSCRERCHDDGVAELAVSVTVEATYHDAVSRVGMQAMQHGLTSGGTNHATTLPATAAAAAAVVVVVYIIIRVCVVIATIQHHEPVHAYPLLRYVLSTDHTTAQQDSQALLKAKYCPRVDAVASLGRNKMHYLASNISRIQASWFKQ